MTEAWKIMDAIDARTRIQLSPRAAEGVFQHLTELKPRLPHAINDRMENGHKKEI